MPPQRLFSSFSAGDVTSCTAANPDQVPAHRFMTEHVVEGGNTSNRCWGDLRVIANMLQGRFRQVTEMVLQGLQDGNHRVWRAAVTRNGLVDKCQDNYRHNKPQDPR